MRFNVWFEFFICSLVDVEKSLQINLQKYVDKNETMCYNIIVLDNVIAFPQGMRFCPNILKRLHYA